MSSREAVEAGHIPFSYTLLLPSQAIQQWQCSGSSGVAAVDGAGDGEVAAAKCIPFLYPHLLQQ